MLQVWGKDLGDNKNIKLDFEKEFFVKPKTFLRMASNCPFRITVNNELFGYGPRRMAFGNTSINEYSLSAFIGQNVSITVEIVCYRVANFYIENQEPFFAGEIVENGTIIFDSDDFVCYKDNRKLSSVRRFSFQRGFTEYYDYFQNREKVNTEKFPVCKLRDNDVPYPRFNRWEFLEMEQGEVVISKKHCEAWDEEKKKINFIDVVEPKYNISSIFRKIGFRKKENEKRERQYYRLFALPMIKTGFVEMDISVEEDANLIVYFDELISTGNPPFLYDGATYINPYQRSTVAMIHYILPKGKYKLCSFEPNTMKYCGIAVYKGRAVLENISFLTYENGGEKFRFQCEEEEVALLMDSALNTFNQSCVDILMDCPSRERAGWLADSYFSGRAENFINGNNKIEENTLRCFGERKIEESIPQGVFPMCYPSDHKDGQYIPNWGMWLILELLDYKKRSGDVSLVEEFRLQVLAFVEHYLKYLDKNGLLCGLKGWVFIEWSRANSLTQDVNFPTNMLFYATLCAVKELYQTNEYVEIAETLKNAIYKYGYDGKFFLDNAITTANGYKKTDAERTETCQYYAFYFGFADKERNPELYRCLFEELCGREDVSEKYPFLSRASNFFGLYMRLDYLSDKVSGNRLLEDVKRYFLSEAKATGTYWEAHHAKDSCCHGFTSVIVEFVLKAVFGFFGFDAQDKPILRKTDYTKDAEVEFFHNEKKYILRNKKGEVLWETECQKELS